MLLVFMLNVLIEDAFFILFYLFIFCLEYKFSETI